MNAIPVTAAVSQTDHIVASVTFEQRSARNARRFGRTRTRILVTCGRTLNASIGGAVKFLGRGTFAGISGRCREIRNFAFARIVVHKYTLFLQTSVFAIFMTSASFAYAFKAIVRLANKVSDRVCAVGIDRTRRIRFRPRTFVQIVAQLTRIHDHAALTFALDPTYYITTAGRVGGIGKNAGILVAGGAVYALFAEAFVARKSDARKGAHQIVTSRTGRTLRIFAFVRINTNVVLHLEAIFAFAFIGQSGTACRVVYHVIDFDRSTISLLVDKFTSAAYTCF